LVKKLASENHVSVSGDQVNNEVTILRDENRLGSSNNVFKEVLSEYYGWSETDFKKELKQEMLQQAVVAKLDTTAESEAQSTLSQVKAGANFATLASQVSDDTQTKSNGGQYASAITINDQQISPNIISTLFQLKPGQVSGIINTGYSLEIVKLLNRTGDTLTAAHIQFNLQDISTYTKPLEDKQPLHQYIKI
jgi:foldase protein PrsA